MARSQLISEREQKAQAIVDTVRNLADGFQKAAAAGQMTDQEAKGEIFNAAASMIWYEDHTNYVFIYDYETGICVANPGATMLLRGATCARSRMPTGCRSRRC